MTVQTVYEAKDFLFSSKEEAELFEKTFSIEDNAPEKCPDFSYELKKPKERTISASMKFLTDIDDIFSDEYLPETIDVYVLSSESDDMLRQQRIYKVIYYVDDGLMDVYKKSSLHCEIREKTDCVFRKGDVEASQYWIRIVNGASLKRQILSADDMKTALSQLFIKRVY